MSFGNESDIADALRHINVLDEFENICGALSIFTPALHCPTLHQYSSNPTTMSSGKGIRCLYQRSACSTLRTENNGQPLSYIYWLAACGHKVEGFVYCSCAPSLSSLLQSD